MSAATEELLSTEHGAVSTFTFQPGAGTGWHTHEHDYVIVPFTDGVMTVETDEQTVQQRIHAAESYRREAGARHNVTNETDEVFGFIEIEHF